MSTAEPVWFKSSYSGTEGDSCLEIALAWRKSTYSSDQGDDCVEVATLPSAVHVRDSKILGSPELVLSTAAWEPFVAQAGDFAPDSLPFGG
ncbi:DUF397 domain-containing protein [Streptomyces scabiei]|uniref:DUF397 domain-containing protein n=1 Tax=Streptomyces scabiei TaxID=1930 RepID=UPI001B326CFA|nr:MULTISPECIES: DUF397 domain-containing protein [Streptomyces]MBP5890389.1 DUF397 domain-containing protein [Streptomyces sp. LBUM 1481]MBP5920428.1 DUF397 domain-containing protein [Streptomyces sp. LBUM 1483]MDX2690251.1 DUF397 domain-containing protein [Streptomyces scabiei]MDX2752626.1 DUF397 domain-containing protein [Streptomyces scabiei]MDX2809760.1 DUF397 domain-containing protein [Streptomyces scabiei]